MSQISPQQSEYRIDVEIADMLNKEAIEIAQNSREQFLSHIFLRLKKDQSFWDADVGRHNQTRRPHVQDRLKGRLLLHPSSKGVQETPEIFMEKSALSVQSASVRFGVSSTNLHKKSEANYQSFETSRSPVETFSWTT